MECPHITKDRENIVIKKKDKLFSFSFLGIRFTMGFKMEENKKFSFGINFTRLVNRLKRMFSNDKEIIEDELEENIQNEKITEEEIIDECKIKDEEILNEKDNIIIKSKDNIATFIMFGFVLIISTNSKDEDDEIEFDGNNMSDAFKHVKDNIKNKEKDNENK